MRGKYRVPFYMSTDCEGILRRFLVLNPTKRCTLEVRRTHCGCTKNLIFRNIVYALVIFFAVLQPVLP